VTQFGLIAEQVEKVNPDLVVRDEDGKVSTVRYEAVNAMLLNEFLKEHRKVEEQQAAIAELRSSLASQAASSAKQEAFIVHQQKQVEALTTAVRKVSAQSEFRAAARKIAVTNEYAEAASSRLCLLSYRDVEDRVYLVGPHNPEACATGRDLSTFALAITATCWAAAVPARA
jgi:hypothetical protein